MKCVKLIYSEILFFRNQLFFACKMSQLQIVIASVSVILVSVLYYILLVGWAKKPKVSFIKLVFDRANRRIELIALNEEKNPVYVMPSLRLVHFRDPSEYKEQRKNGDNSVSMLEGSNNTNGVIKGYSLLGESEIPVLLNREGESKIVYEIPDEIEMSAYDNVKIDIAYGVSPANLDYTLATTLRVIPKDPESFITVSDAPDFSMLGYMGFKGAYDEAAILKTDILGFDTGLPDISLPEAVEAEKGSRVFENGFPIHSTCVCCGKHKWLTWVVDSQYVCVECKDFLQSQFETPIQEGLVKQDRPASDDEPKARVKFKPRHEKILQLLEDDSLSTKDIAEKLGRKTPNVSSDLKFLLDNKIVDRIKSGKQYVYYIV